MAALAPFFAVSDMRTEEELDHFTADMPLVSAGLKGILELDELLPAVRLLPAIAHVSGLTQLTISDILMVGGGCLLDKYSMSEKVLQELAGKTIADGTNRQLDYDLHSNLLKHRHMLICLHRECVAVEKEDRIEKAGTLSMAKQLDSFSATHHFELEPKQYSTGMYAKALFKAGLGYVYDDRTDWRRATPASGRRITVEDDGTAKLAAAATLSSGADVRNCLVRKMYTVLLIHGEADLTGKGFRTEQYGTRGTTVHWITLADILAFEKATKDMAKLSTADATIEADWLEGKLAEQVNGTAKMTLACALGYKLPAFESRLNVAEGKAAAATRKTDQKRQLSPGEKSKAEKKKEQKKQKRAAAKARKAALTAKPGPGAVTAVKPGNGTPLKRMVGGNPAGPPCRNFESGKCTGPCRFSHNQDDDDDLAQIDDEEDPADDE